MDYIKLSFENMNIRLHVFNILVFHSFFRFHKTRKELIQLLISQFGLIFLFFSIKFCL